MGFNMLEIFVVNIVPVLKEFLPWIIILGGIVKWWWERKDKDEANGLSRLETLSRVEERLRESLEKQLQVTEVKLELANKEIERLKLMLARYEIECSKLKAELQIEIEKNKNP